MNVILKNKTLQYLFVVFATMVSINFWSFDPVPDIVYKVLDAAVMLVFIIILFFNSYVFSKQGLLFKSNVLWFTFLPFLSAIGALVYHHQPLMLSITLLRINFFWLFYFVLHVFKIEKKKIIQLMIFVGCVWAFLTIVQQFTYPKAYFFTRGDDDGGGAAGASDTGEDSAIYRAGVYRFMLTGIQYGLFVLMFYFYKYVTTNSNKKINYVPFILFMLLGFYYYGTRQYLISMVASLGMAVLYLKPNPRIKYILIGIPTVLAAWALKHYLFGQFIELTNQQMQYGYSQDVRVLCAKFYLFDYWPHWTAKIIGNGPPHELSSYGRQYDLILSYFHFYRSDIGMIGTYNKYGILYVINAVWTIIKVMRTKDLDYKQKYLRVFFFNSLVLLVISEAFSNEKGMVFFCFVLYMIDVSVAEYKQQRAVAQEEVYEETPPELGYAS